MSREEHYSPFRPAPGPRISTQGDLLYEFVMRDHTRIRCELVDHGPKYGIEARILHNE